MDALSPDQRTVVHLHYYENIATERIAQMLGMRPATVRSHLHRARTAMRNALEDAGFARGAASTVGFTPTPKSPSASDMSRESKRAAKHSTHSSNTAPEQGGPR